MEKVILDSEYNYFKFKNNDIESFKKTLPAKLDLNRITLHWSAGSYTMPYSHYAINIGNIDTWVCDDMNNWHNHSHSWKDNTQNLGLAFLGMANSDYKILDIQIETMINYLTEICKKYNLPVNKIYSHADRARLFGYYPDRVDIEINYKGMLLTNYIKNKVAENLKQKEIPKQEIEVKKIPTIFNDVFYNNWYAEPILKCNTLNLMTGNIINNKKVFRPLDLITRGEVIASVDKVLNYILEHTNKKIEIPNGDIEFKDLDATNWCYQSVKDLCNLKVISGYKENDLNLIKLENNLTRAEFCVIITNLVKLLNVDIESVSTKIGFEDLNSNAWCFKSITWCYNNNILSGYKEVEGHFFKPNNKIKRCEIAVAIYKLLKFFKIEGLN